MLCAGTLAEEAEFPGAAELLFDPAEGAGFPVDAVLHARWIGNRDALGQIRKRILDVEHAYREASRGHGGPGWQSEEDRELAREFEAVLQSSAHPPMLRASLGLALGAPTREELERRVGLIRERFGDVALHRPRGLQHRLFFDHLPRTDGGAVPDYRQQMTIEQFAAMVPTATSGVGSADRLLCRLHALGHPAPGPLRPGRGEPRPPARPASSSPGRSARGRRSPPRRSPSPPSGAARSSSTSTRSPITASRRSPSWPVGSRSWSCRATRPTGANSTRSVSPPRSCARRSPPPTSSTYFPIHLRPGRTRSTVPSAMRSARASGASGGSSTG